MTDNQDLNQDNLDLEKLLEQKDRLDNIIHDKYTRHITVMFTDLKGSTSMTESEGDVVIRMLIKKHNDILFPIIKEHKGVLVKTMGDGTMSYFDNALDAVEAAIMIHKKTKEHNSTTRGLPIKIRIGLNSGNGIVEENDIYGDVVNVASRFESISNPGEIYISEETYGSISSNRNIYCRHIKNTMLKGKSDEFKVFKVFWNPDEIKKDKSIQHAPVPGANEALKEETMQSRKTGMRRSSVIRKKPVRSNVLFSKHKEMLSNIKNELSGRIIHKGETFRLSNASYRVMGNIIVDNNATLIVDNTKLFFAENAGIIVLGSIKMKDSLLSAIDLSKRWNNVTIFKSNSGMNVIENTDFEFGHGKKWSTLSQHFDLTRPDCMEKGFYGGGLFISGGTETTVHISCCTFKKCTATEGGGIYLHKSDAKVEDCLFDSCTSLSSGGAISGYKSDSDIIKCTFNRCSSGKEGGGAYCLHADITMNNCMFRGCLSKYNGGGIACINSKPIITGCRFENCITTKSGGAIYVDRKSKPKIAYPSFIKCRPDDTNLNI